MDIEKIEGFLNELEEFREMWSSFCLDVAAARRSEDSMWRCFGIVFKLSEKNVPCGTEIRFRLDDRLVIAHHCEAFSFDRFARIMRVVSQGTLNIGYLSFSTEGFASGHFIIERKPGWSREGLHDEEGWPALIFRSYEKDSDLTGGLEDIDDMLKIHEEPYESLRELTGKYLNGVDIGGGKRGAIYGVVPRYFKLENLKLDETGTIDVTIMCHKCIDPSDLRLSVIIRGESGVLDSYQVTFDETPFEEGNCWRIEKHINRNLQGVKEARLYLVYKSRRVFEDWIQLGEPALRIIDRTSSMIALETLTYPEIIVPNEVVKKLPKEVQLDIIKAQVCLNLSQEYTPSIYEACAMYLRKALATAIIIRFKKDGSDGELYDEDGRPFQMGKMLELAKQKRYLSYNLWKELKRIKWFGDTGVHDYKIELKKSDIRPIFELMRLTLEPLYY